MRSLFRKIPTLDIKLKFAMIGLGLGLIHVAFLCAFAVKQIMPLFCYNLIVVLFYFYVSMVVIKKGNYIFALIAIYIEILICAVSSSLMLGWSWGFGMYTLSMIPAMYYMIYMIPDIKSKIGIPTIMSAIVGACFILTRVACGRLDPFYSEAQSLTTMQITLYYFNIIIAIEVLLLFSTLFALEIICMQNRLEKENAYLGEIANVDPLTHLLNRRSMNLRLKSALEMAEDKGEAFCIALMDIDDFKKVNDTYGHDCGDEILVSVAQIISDGVGEEGAVCRWGGEEILVIMNTDMEKARVTAEKICSDVRKNTVVYESHSVNVTITIGMAVYERNQTLHNMIAEADKNMYYGKQHGKNQVVASSC